MQLRVCSRCDGTRRWVRKERYIGLKERYITYNLMNENDLKHTNKKHINIAHKFLAENMMVTDIASGESL